MKHNHTTLNCSTQTEEDPPMSLFCKWCSNWLPDSLPVQTPLA